MNVILYFVMAIVTTTTRYHHTSAQQVVACGPMLAKFREEVCFGEMDKRGQMYSAMGPSNKLMADSWPLRERNTALQWYRLKRDGLVNECCMKPCTRDEIRNYC